MNRIFFIILIILTSCDNNQKNKTPIKNTEQKIKSPEQKSSDFDELTEGFVLIGEIELTESELEEQVRQGQLQPNKLKEILRKRKYCDELTKNGRFFQGMSQSHFKSSGDEITQVMYVSELVGGYGKKYRVMVDEIKDSEYIEIMAQEMIKNYRMNGVFENFENQGFTSFRLQLVTEDPILYNSKSYTIY